MKLNLYTIFCKAIKQQTSFLHEKYAFSPVKVSSEICGWRAVFIGKKLAIEFSLDSRDGCVDCYIIKVVSGKLINDYRIDEFGGYVRLRLVEILWAWETYDLMQYNKVTQEEYVSIMIEYYANQLKKYGLPILNDEMIFKKITSNQLLQGHTRQLERGRTLNLERGCTSNLDKNENSKTRE